MWFEFCLVDPAKGANPFLSFCEKRPHVNAARKRSGRYAKNFKCEVHLASVGPEPWLDRYITTARPCRYATNGHMHERMPIHDLGFTRT